MASTERQEILGRAFEQSRITALEKAGGAEAKVKDVKEIQKKGMHELLYGNAQGTDGSAAGGEELWLEPEAETLIENDHQERMKSVAAAEDAHVFRRVDETAGVQNDGDRSIGIAHDILLDEKAAKRVALHEGEHAKQETGAQVAEIPKTGIAAIDKRQGKLERLFFRENGSIKAEGGLDNHTEEYHAYVNTSDATREFLASMGMNGDQLVNDAGRTVKGFETLHRSMVQAVIEKRREESNIPAFSAN